MVTLAWTSCPRADWRVDVPLSKSSRLMGPPPSARPARRPPRSPKIVRQKSEQSPQVDGPTPARPPGAAPAEIAEDRPEEVGEIARPAVLHADAARLTGG